MIADQQAPARQSHAKATAIKEAVRERDGWRCRVCEVTWDDHVERFGRGLDVHRLTPGSHYTLDGCVLVCCECHGRLPKRQHGHRDHGPNGNVRTFRLPVALVEQLKALTAITRRKMTTNVVIALEAHLKAAGFWPPPDDSGHARA